MTLVTLVPTAPIEVRPQPIRVETPAQMNSRTVVTFVLPVEPAGQSQYGDGFSEACKHNLANRLNTIVVAPEFGSMPWYANHPSELHLQQERYLLETVMPLLDHQFSRRRRFLIGFSKSGYGALSLLLRNPRVFRAAAVWDAPLLVHSIDRWEMGSIFGNLENFAQYHVAALIRSKARVMRRACRIALGGYCLFRNHIEGTHDLLNSLSIPHLHYSDIPHDHRWSGGWFGDCLDALAAQVEELR